MITGHLLLLLYHILLYSYRTFVLFLAVFLFLNTGLNNAIVDLSQDTQGQFVLKNGLKMCWGRQTTNNGVITFPIKFRSAPYVIGNFQNSNAELTMVSNILTVSATGFTYQGKYSKDFATWTTYYSGFVWFAIGY